MTTAVLPGSFDPPTYGHLSIIKRASRLFDSIDVVIAVNPDKKISFFGRRADIDDVSACA